MILYEASTGSTIIYILSGLLVGYLLYSFIRAQRRMNRPPSENVTILDDNNFETTIKKGVSLVDFWATWCAPCKIQGPIVDEVADELHGQANICKLDVDKNPKTAGKYGIQSIPTIMVFKNGKPVKKLAGVNSKAALVKAVQSQI